ncbi:MAG: hypothetical protein KAW46_05210, partial [candidate division Zixibacteria bacterium]|nr:hypothetical protein [candidate division Zixibacteria bacterium]
LSEQLQERLNSTGRPYIEASATIGNGVFDTLKLIIKLVLDKAKSTGTRSEPASSEAAAATAQPAAATATAVMSAQTASASRPYPTAEPEVTATPPPVVSTEPSDPMVTTPESPSYQEPSPVATRPGPEAVDPSPVVGQATPSAATESVESSRMPESAVESADDSQPASSRPFPGDRDESGAKKITPTAFTPTPKESSAEVSYEKNVLENSSADTGAAQSGRSLPGMAPPLRRRCVSKKRGFFKRLFGIK